MLIKGKVFWHVMAHNGKGKDGIFSNNTKILKNYDMVEIGPYNTLQNSS